MSQFIIIIVKHKSIPAFSVQIIRRDADVFSDVSGSHETLAPFRFFRPLATALHNSIQKPEQNSNYRIVQNDAQTLHEKAARTAGLMYSENNP
jgi:hypothetical protein